ncbi:hypothetical protein [Pseudomonas edaphica]|uniref:hypothetical protein n=1 Tax=Pseudomonas edaphica TaxID=2006980 RepID=UPI003D0A8707
MNKHFSVILVGSMLLAMNAWAAEESPSENTMNGKAAGTIIVESDGASVFRVSDGDFADPLTIGVAGSLLREGKNLYIENKGSKATNINIQNTTLTSPLNLPAESNVQFTVTSGKWVSKGVRANEKVGAPGTGQVTVPPVSK